MKALELQQLLAKARTEGKRKYVYAYKAVSSPDGYALGFYAQHRCYWYRLEPEARRHLDTLWPSCTA